MYRRYIELMDNPQNLVTKCMDRSAPTSPMSCSADVTDFILSSETRGLRRSRALLWKFVQVSTGRLACSCLQAGRVWERVWTRRGVHDWLWVGGEKEQMEGNKDSPETLQYLSYTRDLLQAHTVRVLYSMYLKKVPRDRNVAV